MKEARDFWKRMERGQSPETVEVVEEEHRICSHSDNNEREEPPTIQPLESFSEISINSTCSSKLYQRSHSYMRKRRQQGKEIFRHKEIKVPPRVEKASSPTSVLSFPDATELPINLRHPLAASPQSIPEEDQLAEQVKEDEDFSSIRWNFDDEGGIVQLPSTLSTDESSIATLQTRSIRSISPRRVVFDETTQVRYFHRSNEELEKMKRAKIDKELLRRRKRQAKLRKLQKTMEGYFRCCNNEAEPNMVASMSTSPKRKVTRTRKQQDGGNTILDSLGDMTDLLWALFESAKGSDSEQST